MFSPNMVALGPEFYLGGKPTSFVSDRRPDGTYSHQMAYTPATTLYELGLRVTNGLNDENGKSRLANEDTVVRRAVQASPRSTKPFMEFLLLD